MIGKLTSTARVMVGLRIHETWFLGVAFAVTCGIAVAQTPDSALRPLSESTGSGSIAAKVGDRFIGPGYLSFGRLGARRQIVLPDGEWMLLAGSDWNGQRPTAQGGVPALVPISTVVFGRFDGARLTALLRFSANYRPPIGTSGTSSLIVYPNFDRCDSPAGARLFQERRPPDAFTDECLSIAALPEPLAEAWEANPPTRRALERLGAFVRPGVALVTTSTFTSPRFGYLGIVRIDWPELGAAAESLQGWQADEMAASPERRALVRGIAAAAGEYRKAASEGYRSDYGGSELRAAGAK
jgi:hypothetical protein